MCAGWIRAVLAEKVLKQSINFATPVLKMVSQVGTTPQCQDLEAVMATQEGLWFVCYLDWKDKPETFHVHCNGVEYNI